MERGKDSANRKHLVRYVTNYAKTEGLKWSSGIILMSLPVNVSGLNSPV